MNENWREGTHAVGGFGDRSTFSISRMLSSGFAQNRRGLSPGTGNVSSSADWSLDEEPSHIERAETVAESSARVATLMNFIVSAGKMFEVRWGVCRVVRRIR